MKLSHHYLRHSTRNSPTQSSALPSSHFYPHDSIISGINTYLTNNLIYKLVHRRTILPPSRSEWEQDIGKFMVSLLFPFPWLFQFEKIPLRKPNPGFIHPLPRIFEFGSSSSSSEIRNQKSEIRSREGQRKSLASSGRFIPLSSNWDDWFRGNVSF